MGIFGFGKKEGTPQKKKKSPLEGKTIPNWANPVVNEILDGEHIKSFMMPIKPSTVESLEKIAAELIDEASKNKKLEDELEGGSYHKVGARFVEKVLARHGDDREFLLEAAQILSGPFAQRVSPIHKRVEELDRK